MKREWPTRGGFKLAAQQLGLSESYILQKATTLFQEYKKDFPRVPGGVVDIFIHSESIRTFEQLEDSSICAGQSVPY